MSHDWPLMSHDWPQMSHDWPLMSNDWSQMSHDWPLMSHDWPQILHDWPLRDDQRRLLYQRRLMWLLCLTMTQLQELYYSCTHSRGDEQLMNHLSRYHISFIFSSNQNAESAPTPLPPALLLIISTPDMLWTPPDFGKQFMSTISADYPISPQNISSRTIALLFLLSSNLITSIANNRIHCLWHS